MTIAIASGKGGTGKTLLATNLAAWMAQSVPVMLVDLDVEEPNASLFFHDRVKSRDAVYHQIPVWDSDRCIGCDTCKDVCAFHALIKLGSEVMIFPQLCHSCHACTDLCPSQALPMQPLRMGEWTFREQDTLGLLEGRLDVGQEQAVPLIQATKKKAVQLQQQIGVNHKQDVDGSGSSHGNLGITIIDAPPGTSCPVIEATRDADLVLLVTEPTPFGLHDLQLAVETMRALGKSFAVIINRVGLGNKEVEAYCLREQIPVVAHIEDDRMIAERYAKGKLVYAKIPAFQYQMKQLEQFISQYMEEDRG
jgi:MinD superfamily P-loop ATPase